MSMLTKKNEKAISNFFRDFILSFKSVFKQKFGSKTMQNLEIQLKSIHFLKDIANIDKANFVVTKRLYKIKEKSVQMYTLYPDPLLAVLSDIATGGSGNVKLDGKINELQINSCIDIFNDCYRSVMRLFYDNYKEPLEESSIENIQRGTPQYKAMFEDNDFVVIYSVKLNQSIILNVPILFKYQEVESLLIRLGVLKIDKPLDKSLYKNLDMIASTKIHLTVMLGKTRLPFMNVFKLNAGSMITLDTNVGDNVDVFVKDIKVAEGQIVAVGEYFGIKITKLMQQDSYSDYINTANNIPKIGQTDESTPDTDKATAALESNVAVKQKMNDNASETDEPEAAAPPPSGKPITSSSITDLKESPNTDFNISDLDICVSESEQRTNDLTFDKEKAEKFSNFCVNIAKMMNYHKEALEEIKIAAYYLKIGGEELTPEDVEQPDFYSKMVAASAKKVEKMDFAKDVVYGIRDSRKAYVSNDILDKSSIVPYSHIISLAFSYAKLLETYNNKEACLNILRKQGVQYFNIFVLHRFINYMRKNN